MNKQSLLEESAAFFFKVLLPPIIGVSVKVAVIMQRDRLTPLRIILAYIIGIGVAWLCSPVIFKVVSSDYAPMILATVAITGDKIAEYLIYKFNVDGFLAAVVDTIINSIRKKQ